MLLLLWLFLYWFRDIRVHLIMCCYTLPLNRHKTHNQVENNECAAGNQHCLLQSTYKHQVQIQCELVEKTLPGGWIPQLV